MKRFVFAIDAETSELGLPYTMTKSWVLVQAFRTSYLQLGISEFKKNVMSDKKNLDAL